MRVKMAFCEMGMDSCAWDGLEIFFFYVFIAVKLLLLCLFREVNMVLDEQWNKENERKR